MQICCCPCNCFSLDNCNFCDNYCYENYGFCYKFGNNFQFDFNLDNLIFCYMDCIEVLFPFWNLSDWSFFCFWNCLLYILGDLLWLLLYQLVHMLFWLILLIFSSFAKGYMKWAWFWSSVCITLLSVLSVRCASIEELIVCSNSDLKTMLNLMVCPCLH